MKKISLAIIAITLTACATAPSIEEPNKETEIVYSPSEPPKEVEGPVIPAPVEAPPVVKAPAQITLSFEVGKPERKPWREFIIAHARADLALYDAASDMTLFCPNYKQLDEDGRVKAIGEFWSALMYFESSYNPASYSVDVGQPGNYDTYSVGLTQVSVVDQNWAKGTARRYQFEQLKTAIPNLDLATVIMKRQLTNKKAIVIADGVYWAVIRKGDSYMRREEFCKKNPVTCGASKWKTGWCAMQAGKCRLTVLPDVIARAKKNLPGC